MRTFTIPQSSVGLLYEDGVYTRTLPPGLHKVGERYFDKKKYDVTQVDMRERSLTIKGQEILTKDKVAIRVSLLVYFRIRSAEDAIHNVASYLDRIYEDVQLSARRFLASRQLDAILSDRNEISDTVRDEVKGAAASYGVEIIRADIKDLVFPGNLREIMNRVLETERRAEAKLIEARKEAETQRIQGEAENQEALRKIELLRKKVQAENEVERERLAVQREAQLREAEALREHPELLRLKQTEALAAMAKAGARFVVGLEGSNVGLSFEEL